MKFANSDKASKTERLQHRDSPERLLACLEGIHDDLIAEAAQAAENVKTPRWQWFNLGSAAAVFIGAIAVSCVLMLAFWLTGADVTEAPHGYENGYYTAETPPPQPGELVPGGILPLPEIHASGFEVVLPAYQQHMTINNPWHNIGHIDTLPVFRSHSVSHFNYATGQHRIEIQLADDEWDEFVYMLHTKGQAIAAAANISRDRISPTPQSDSMFVSTIIDGYRSIASKQMGTLSLHTHLSPAYDERIGLPPGASLSNDAANMEIQAAIEYLARRLAAAVPMTSPTITNAQGVSDIGGRRTYHSQRFFDSGGSPEEAILSFNFEWVEILTFDPNYPDRIEIALFPHRHFESLQLGHYPIITVDAAREMLLEGYFVSNFPDSMWPGQERAMDASVELVYHLSTFNSSVEAIMPFYRFLVEIEMPLWHRDSLGEAAGDYRAFARYYVPAVHRDYIEPMARRNISDPPQAPTGPRALPADIFEIVRGDELWRPLRIARADVAELWDEVISEIGELAVNEAYQFRTACGHYAMITGNRNFATREELHRYFPGFGCDEAAGETYTYFPGFDLPETVGDFSLHEISVFDQTQDVMFIFNRAMSPFEHVFGFGSGNPGPVGEIFTREAATFSIFAMYENNEGVQIGLGITLPIMGLHFMPEDEDPHSILDMGEYGLIHFQGRPGEYFRAMHEAIYPHNGFVLELWFVNGSIDGRQLTWDLAHGPWHGSPDGFRGTHWFTPVDRAELEELVRIFNPAALAAEYNWNLMSLQ
ncbi:MAG: hypothetical protein FWC77_02975 [Defluviitaleaceae bacterium]|nr:hypothetical protein [Defluviitaleaceae bacterium]